MDTLALITSLVSLALAVTAYWRAATTAVRAHAEDARKKIEQVLADTDRLVSTLESDEDKAAKPSS